MGEEKKEGGKVNRKKREEKKGKSTFSTLGGEGRSVKAKTPEKRKRKKKRMERNPETFLTKAIELEVSLWTFSIWRSRSL